MLNYFLLKLQLLKDAFPVQLDFQQIMQLCLYDFFSAYAFARRICSALWGCFGDSSCKTEKFWIHIIAQQ